MVVGFCASQNRTPNPNIQRSHHAHIGPRRNQNRNDFNANSGGGALGGTRTPTVLPTATSRQRVYQFRHER